jgi:acyl carrier protein
MSAQQIAPTPAAVSAGEIAEALRAYLARISDGKLGAADIDLGAHLFDHGYVDSLSAVTFMAHVEERYGVRLDDLDLVERFTSLASLAEHLVASRA